MSNTDKCFFFFQENEENVIMERMRLAHVVGNNPKYQQKNITLTSLRSSIGIAPFYRM